MSRFLLLSRGLNTCLFSLILYPEIFDLPPKLNSQQNVGSFTSCLSNVLEATGD